MASRMLARVAPIVIGAVAGAIWLRGRKPERPALTAPPKPPGTRFVRASEGPRVDIVTVVDDLLGTAP